MGVSDMKIVKLASVLFLIFLLLSPQASAALARGWAAAGENIDNSLGNKPQSNQAALALGNGITLVAWLDQSTGAYRLMAQKYNVNGEAQWTAGGVVINNATGWLSGTVMQYEDFIQIVSDGADGAFIAWKDIRNNSQADIYAQRVNGSGAVQWAENGSGVCTNVSAQTNPRMVSDGGTGAILAWLDDRDGTHSNSIYTQMINSSGAKQWGDSDLCIYNYSTGGKTAFYPAITADGGGGAVIAWYDGRSVNGYEIYAQQAKTNGTVSWQANGITVCDVVGQAVEPSILNAGGGGFIIAWWDGRDGVIGQYDVYAQKIQGGVAAWAENGVAVTTSANYYLTPDMNLKVALVTDGAGGAIFAWPDYRNNTYGVFVQKFDGNGAAQWLANGVAVNNNCNYAFSFPRLVSDGLGGAIVAWSDFRNNSSYDLYAQLVNSAGAVQWAANGLAVCTESTTDQVYPRIVSDGLGGAVVIWKDGRADSYGGDIYGERINAGDLKWGDKPGDNKPLANNKGTVMQMNAVAVSDGAGGVVTAWMDSRAGGNKYYDIYAQRFDSNGTAQWSNALAITSTANLNTSNYYPSICQTSDGKFVIAWYDDYGIIYVQKIDNTGAREWTSGGVKVLNNNATYAGSLPVVSSDGAGGVVVAYTVTAPAGMGMGALPRSNWLASAYLNDAGLPDLDGKLLAMGGGGGVVKYQIYYKRVDTDGNIVTPYNNAAQDATTPGVLATTFNDDVNGQIQLYSSITKLDDTYAMITWDDKRTIILTNYWGIYAQKVKIEDGTRQWTNDAKPVLVPGGATVTYAPHIANTVDGKAIVTWMQSAAYANHNYDVLAYKIDGDGNLGSLINVANSAGVDEIRPRVAVDSTGAFFVVWQEGTWVYDEVNPTANLHPGTSTMANGQIYGQFFTSAGVAQGSKFKVFDSNAVLEYPDVALTTSQGSDIVVTDTVVTDNNDIIGQKVSGLTVPKAEGPTAPTKLAGAADSSTAIIWSWTDTSKDETGFKIYETQKNLTIATIAFADVTSYTETKLAPNTAYSRRLCAYNKNGNSSLTESVTAWTLASIPSNLSATLKAREITLAWTGDGTKYKVWRGPSADGPWTVAGDNIKDKFLNDTGLLPETTYWYKVAPYNGAEVIAPACDPSSFKTGGASALAPQIGAGKHFKTKLGIARGDSFSAYGDFNLNITDPNVGGKINYVKVEILDAAGNVVKKSEYTEVPEKIRFDQALSPGTYSIRTLTRSSTGTETEKVFFDLKVSNRLSITQTPVVYPLAIPRSSIKAQGVAATQVAYQLSMDGNVSMIIYGVDGQIVYRGDYVAGQNGGSAGPNAVSWDGYATFTRAPAGRGLYFVQFIDRDSKQLLGKAVVHVQ
jgi:hypothetical protein